MSDKRMAQWWCLAVAVSLVALGHTRGDEKDPPQGAAPPDPHALERQFASLANAVALASTV